MKFGILVRAIGIFFISLTTLVSGCGDSDKKSLAKSPEKSPDRPYTVVCTIGMITDIVRNVVKEHAKVEGIIGEGVDPREVRLHAVRPPRRVRFPLGGEPVRERHLRQEQQIGLLDGQVLGERAHRRLDRLGSWIGLADGDAHAALS